MLAKAIAPLLGTLFDGLEDECVQVGLIGGSISLHHLRLKPDDQLREVDGLAAVLDALPVRPPSPARDRGTCVAPQNGPQTCRRLADDDETEGQHSCCS